MQARSGDAGFIRAVETKRCAGVVHSVFSRALNLRFDDGPDLYTLLSRRKLRAPNTLNLGDVEFQAAGIAVGDRVAAADGVIDIAGKLRVGVGGASPWQPAIPALHHDADRMRAGLEIAGSFVLRHGMRGGALEDHCGPLLSRMVSRRIGDESDSLVVAYRAGRIVEAVDHASRLIGLGPGLTPSGDDLLLGFLAALHTRRPLPAEAAAFGAAVVRIARLSTNDISLAGLVTAADGAAGEVVSNLLCAICNAAIPAIETAVRDVLTIGASSGTDMALGVISGLRASCR